MSSRVNIHELAREFTVEKSFLYERQNSGKRIFAESKRLNGGIGGSRRFQLPKGSSGLTSVVSRIRLLKNFAEHVARALCMVSGKRSTSSPPPSGIKNSLSARSKPFVAPLDSHRMEAIEDCIQFINSKSSTLSRSNSTAIPN